MSLPRIDQAGLFVSGRVDITLNPEVFLHCLLGLFLNKPSELGYSCAKEIPHHVPAQGKTLQVINMDGNVLCLDKQIAGPWTDHLAVRGTDTLKAYLISDDQEKDGNFFCVKASWAQMERKHKGYYIKKLHDVGFEELAFSPEKAGEENNTQLGSEQLKMCIRNYHNRCQNKESSSNKGSEVSKHY